MPESFQVFPVGVIRKDDKTIWIDIHEPYADALLGLEGFSHILVLFWFHENDTVDRRQTLRVHPRGDEHNPLTGVFGTHSPLRPNLVGLTRCKIRAVEGRRIHIEDIDALDKTPVIDIKCYIPDPLAEAEIRLPSWV
jgi:tRNA-Thr(GGU) m(6)t(6)A37 methyltransferase TsaA